MAELAIIHDAHGNFLRTEVVERGSVGALEGGVAQLGNELHVDPYVLRRAIARGEVPAEFLGGGRYRIGGDVVARGFDASGHLRPDPQADDAEHEQPATLSPRPVSLVEQMFGEVR